MELPQLVAQFAETQNTYDSRAYTECFTKTAIVHDEGKTHTGKEEIKAWIEAANEEYKSAMKPLKYEESELKGVLTAEVSGTFPGSPIVLQFHLGLKDSFIDSLMVTGTINITRADKHQTLHPRRNCRIAQGDRTFMIGLIIPSLSVNVRNKAAK